MTERTVPCPRAALARVIVAAVLGLLLVVCLASSPVRAQGSEKRVALVIGNSAYRSVPKLPNPANDAEDVATALRADGFEVIEGRDLDRRGMDAALGRFSRAVAESDVALFYYAGHGLQFRGENFLVPVDGAPTDEFSVPYETTRVADVMDALSHTRGVRILVLDACRNNPLTDKISAAAGHRGIGAERGLARIPQTQGMVIAYATQPNDVANDGSGRNSPFSSALVDELKEPGLEIGQLFRRVAVNVNQRTKGQQTPELSISLLGDFYFNRTETDVQAWSKIRDEPEPAVFRAFLARFPRSYLVDAAKARLDVIERSRREEELRGQLARIEDDRRRAAQQTEEQARTEQARIARERGERERLDTAQADAKQRAEAQAAEEQARQQQKLSERLARLEEENRKASAELASRAAEEDRRAKDEHQREAQARERDGVARLQADTLKRAEDEAALQKAAQERDTADRLAKLEEQNRLAKAELAARTKAAEDERQRVAQERAQLLGEIEAERRKAAEELARLQGEKADAVAREQAAPKPPAGSPDRSQQVASLPGGPIGVAPLPAPAVLVSPIKRELARLGCYRGEIDESWSTAPTTRAVQDVVRLAHLQAPDGPTDDFLNALKAQPARICPQLCGRRQVERGGACVAKTCPAGQVLDRDGDCVGIKAKPVPEKRVVQRSVPAAAAAAPAPSGGGRGKCFAFGGRSYCE